MARELTPEQTAALEAFETAAQGAADKHTASTELHTQFSQVEAQIQVADQAALASYQDALEKANAFRDAMLPPQTGPTPAPPAAQKK